MPSELIHWTPMESNADELEGGDARVEGCVEVHWVLRDQSPGQRRISHGGAARTIRRHFLLFRDLGSRWREKWLQGHLTSLTGFSKSIFSLLWQDTWNLSVSLGNLEFLKSPLS